MGETRNTRSRQKSGSGEVWWLPLRCLVSNSHAASETNAPKLLQVGKEVFDHVPQFVAFLVVFVLNLPVFLGWDSCYNLTYGERKADSVCIVGFICNEFVRMNAVEKSGQLLVLCGVPWYYGEPYKPAGLIDHSHQLGGKPASTAAYGLATG